MSVRTKIHLGMPVALFYYRLRRIHRQHIDRTSFGGWPFGGWVRQFVYRAREIPGQGNRVSEFSSGARRYLGYDRFDEEYEWIGVRISPGRKRRRSFRDRSSAQGSRAEYDRNSQRTRSHAAE